MNNPSNPTVGYQGENAGGYCGPLDAMLVEDLPDVSKSLSEINAAVVVMGSAYNQNMRSLYDLFGHEYQHTVFQKYAGSSNPDEESGAVDEGIADIMGELYESSHGEINWEHGRRIIHDPSQNGYPESVDEINSKLLDKLDTDFSHGCSTVISHAAYLMWNGIDGSISKKLSTDELANLWYRATLMMPSDCTFSECRQLVLLAAQSMDLSDVQIQGIGEAFDEVGIYAPSEKVDYRVNEQATLSVLDELGNPYGDYTVCISFMMGDRDCYSMINTSKHVGSSEPYALNLIPGTYEFMIVSKKFPEYRYEFVVEIDPESTDNTIVLQTSFVDALVVTITDYEDSPLSQIIEYNEDGNLEAVYDFAYNTDALLSEITTRIYNDGAYSYQERIVYTYSDTGQLLTATNDYLAGGSNSYTNIWEKEYSYTDSGLLQSVKASKGADATDYPFSAEYEYDSDGRRIKATQWAAGVDIRFSTRYIYDANGHLIETEEQGETHSILTDNDGRIVEERHEDVYTTYASVYDYSYEPFEIMSQYENGKLKSSVIRLRDANGEILFSADISMVGAIGATTSLDDLKADEPQYFTDDNGCLVKVIGSGSDHYANVDRITEFYYGESYGVDTGAMNTEEQSDSEKEPEQSEDDTLISEDEAYQIVCDYWNYSEGRIDAASGYEMGGISRGGLVEESDGTPYYMFGLILVSAYLEDGTPLGAVAETVSIHAITGDVYVNGEMATAEDGVYFEDELLLQEQSISWNLDERGVLTLTGNGAMEDYEPAGSGWGSWVSENIVVDTQYSYSSDDIKTIIVSKGITDIGAAAFAYCHYVTSIEIADGVVSIGDWAFLEDSHLASIIIPGSVTSIGRFAFWNCVYLTDVYYGGTEEEWDQIEIAENNDPLYGATIHFDNGT